MTDTEEYSGFRVVEKLECQIQAMEAELADLQLNISIRRKRNMKNADPLLLQGKQLDAEAKLYKTSVPDIDLKDRGVSYFLAVGALEKEISDLKDYRKVLDKRVETNEAIVSELQQNLDETMQVVERFQKLAEDKQNESSKVDKEEAETADRMKLENDLRKTRQLTKEFKLFLKEYINKIGTQEEGIEEDRVPLGLLLQELWREWNISDKDGWINIEDLDFDVREQDVAKLLASEVIKQRKEDQAIQMVDFTMRY